MPNIFKHFLRPQVDKYSFPQADEIELEEDSVDLPPPEEEESTSAPSAQEGAEAEDAEPEGSAAAMLSYAKVQADEIVAQARREGEALLEEYRQQAAEQIQQLQEEAKQEGFRQGYTDGMAKAQIENQAKLEEQLQQQTEQIKAFLQRAIQAKEDLMLQVQDELCDLSIAVAEKVIHISLKSSREVILRMVQMATERLRRREWVHIYIGGCDTRELAQIAPELTASLAGLSDHIKLIPMANDESGTCIIEMPDEIIDASVPTQLDNLKGILRGG